MKFEKKWKTWFTALIDVEVAEFQDAQIFLSRNANFSGIFRKVKIFDPNFRVHFLKIEYIFLFFKVLQKSLSWSIFKLNRCRLKVKFLKFRHS